MREMRNKLGKKLNQKPECVAWRRKPDFELVDGVEGGDGVVHGGAAVFAASGAGADGLGGWGSGNLEGEEAKVDDWQGGWWRS